MSRQIFEARTVAKKELNLLKFDSKAANILHVSNFLLFAIFFMFYGSF